MPLDWLGQLGPTMQQQIALQRALLALQREDEGIRAKTPALAQSLQSGGGAPSAYAGPTSAFDQPVVEEHKTDWDAEWDKIRAAQDRASALQTRLATPSPGYVSGEEKSRLYKEKMYEEREVGAKEAFDRISTLDPAGQKTALNALRRFKREIYNAMEKEGYLSPTGELVQPKQAATGTEWVTADNGELLGLTTYPDGRIETEHTGVYPMQEAEEVEGASPSDLIAMQRLGLDMAKYNSSLMAEAYKLAGDVPKQGLDMVTDADGNTHVATAQDEAVGLSRVAQIYNTLVAAGGSKEEVATKGEATMSDVEREFNASSAEGKMAMQAKLGVPQTGEWDEATAFAMETYGEVLLTEKPPKEPPKELTPEEKAAKIIETGGAP